MGLMIGYSTLSPGVSTAIFDSKINFLKNINFSYNVRHLQGTNMTITYAQAVSVHEQADLLVRCGNNCR